MIKVIDTTDELLPERGEKERDMLDKVTLEAALVTAQSVLRNNKVLYNTIVTDENGTRVYLHEIISAAFFNGKAR